jgi:hypothetical protein
MASIYTTILTHITLTLLPLLSPLHCVGEAQGQMVLFLSLSNPIAEYPIDFLLLAMAPVVRIEPNGVQTLLLFDNAREDFLG